jgi:hypothetical protein
MTRDYKVVDAFSARPPLGNPVAVAHAAGEVRLGGACVTCVDGTLEY